MICKTPRHLDQRIAALPQLTSNAVAIFGRAGLTVKTLSERLGPRDVERLPETELTRQRNPGSVIRFSRQFAESISDKLMTDH
jgi:hypothetical protein